MRRNGANILKVDAKPYFRLRKGLYGLSFSGANWMAHVEQQLTQLGWSPVSSAQQFFRKVDGAGNLHLLACFVDDIVISGIHGSRELAAIRKLVTTTEPTPVSRLLGVVYSSVYKKELGGHHVTIGMSEYSKAVVERFESNSDAPKTKPNVKFPFRAEQVGEATDTRLQGAGALAKKAPSYVMALLWLARQGRPDLMASVTTLAKALST